MGMASLRNFESAVLSRYDIDLEGGRGDSRDPT